MKRVMIQLMLLCLIWHARVFPPQHVEDAVAFFNSLPSNTAQAHIVAGSDRSTSFQTWIVTWATECKPTPTPNPRAVPTSTPVPKPTPDWRVMPKKYRTPNPIWKPGDPR